MINYRNSAVSDYIRCPLAFHFAHNLHLQKIDDDSGEHHRRFGQAIHSALEVIYVDRDLEKAKVKMRECYPVQLDTEDLAKTVDNACFALEKYIEHYDWDKEWTVLSTEETDYDGSYVAVTPDMVVKDRNDNIFIVDHKTTGKYLNYDYFSDYDPNSQVTHYVQRTRERYGHCDGFIVNAIRFAFLKRASKDRAAGFNVEFERQVFQRTSSQIQRTERSTEEWIEEIEHSRRRGHWRAAETSSACKFCSYKSICSAGWSWEDDEELITNVFRRVCQQKIGNDYCNLDLNHSGDHRHELVAAAPVEFVVEV
jgi:CRISPR/Cas system-associated exonuclease Cas4 (RecB family)